MAEWYENYLASPHWLRVRGRKILEAGGVCERCGEHGRLFEDRWFGIQVHHLTYERIGHEAMSDLQVLCVACHKIEHALIDEDGRAKVRAEQLQRFSGFCMFMGDAVDWDDIGLEVRAWDELADAAGC